MIVLLAARSLLRRARQSLLVSGLIAAAIALLFLGNAVLSSTEEGLRRSFAESFTGELAIAAISPRPFGVFGDETPAIGQYTPLPVIRDFPAVMEVVSRIPEIERATPLVSGVAVVDLGGTRRALPVFGIDASSHFRAFPRLQVLEGELLQPGKPGALISQARAREITMRTGRHPVPGDAVILNMFGRRGFRIEEVPLVGIIRFEISNPMLDSTVLVDAQTLRGLLGLMLAESPDYQPPAEAAELLEGDLEGLFAEPRQTREASQGEMNLDEVRQLLSVPRDVLPELSAESGAWHFLLLRLVPGGASGRVLRRLNRELRLAELPAAGMDWRGTAGMSARLVVLLRFVYNAGFVVLALAALIVIVNLLVIQVIERSTEIATLRALGATRGFVRRLMLSEAALLSVSAGSAGVLLSATLLLIVGSIRLRLDNRLLQTLFGGGTLELTVSPMTAILCILMALLIGLVSCLYPVHLALRVQPAGALSSE